jgi:hypothetical protein
VPRHSAVHHDLAACPPANLCRDCEPPTIGTLAIAPHAYRTPTRRRWLPLTYPHTAVGAVARSAIGLSPSGAETDVGTELIDSDVLRRRFALPPPSGSKPNGRPRLGRRVKLVRRLDVHLRDSSRNLGWVQQGLATPPTASLIPRRRADNGAKAGLPREPVLIDWGGMLVQ